MGEELKLEPCPFCGDVPELPSGDGTQYEIECGGCGQAMASVQICELMTRAERATGSFTDHRYGEQFIERAKLEAIERWNTRAQLPSQGGEAVEVVATVEAYGGKWAGIHWGECIGSTEDPERQLMIVAQHQRILAASAGSADHVGVVFTMEALAPGGGVKSHASLNRDLPAGTKLYTHPADQVAGSGDPVGSFAKHMEYMQRCIELTADNQRLEGEVARLRKALEFYADPVRYQGGNQRHESPDKYTRPNAPYLQDITRDYGDIARTTLSTNGEVTE